jgi:hypothetical protein
VDVVSSGPGQKEYIYKKAGNPFRIKGKNERESVRRGLDE